jgi:hypothetical protein
MTLQGTLGVHDHRPELQAPEALATMAEPFMPEKDWATVRREHDDDNKEHRGQGEEQHGGCHNDIKDPLGYTTSWHFRL